MTKPEEKTQQFKISTKALQGFIAQVRGPQKNPIEEALIEIRPTGMHAFILGSDGSRQVKIEYEFPEPFEAGQAPETTEICLAQMTQLMGALKHLAGDETTIIISKSAVKFQDGQKREITVSQIDPTQIKRGVPAETPILAVFSLLEEQVGELVDDMKLAAGSKSAVPVQLTHHAGEPFCSVAFHSESPIGLKTTLEMDALVPDFSFAQRQLGVLELASGPAKIEIGQRAIFIHYTTEEQIKVMHTLAEYIMY